MRRTRQLVPRSVRLPIDVVLADVVDQEANLVLVNERAIWSTPHRGRDPAGAVHCDQAQVARRHSEELRHVIGHGLRAHFGAVARVPGVPLPMIALAIAVLLHLCLDHDVRRVHAEPAVPPEAKLEFVILRRTDVVLHPLEIGAESSSPEQRRRADGEIRTYQAPRSRDRHVERFFAMVGHRQRSPVEAAQPFRRWGVPARKHLASDVVDFRMLSHRANDLRDPVRTNCDVIVREGDDRRARALDPAVPRIREPLPRLEEGVPVLASRYEVIDDLLGIIARVIVDDPHFVLKVTELLRCHVLEGNSKKGTAIVRADHYCDIRL